MGDSDGRADTGTGRGRKIWPWLLLFPVLAFFALAFLVPVGDLALSSFQTRRGEPTLGNYVAIFGDPRGLRILGVSLWISALTTLLCLVMGFPLAWQASRSTPMVRTVILTLSILPMLISSVVRTFGWLVLFYPGGLITSATQALGLGPMVLMGKYAGIVLAQAVIFVPFMILAIYAVLEKISVSLEEAANDLGDNMWQVWWRVTIPLCRGGILAGSLVVFAMSLGAYVTPKLIGQSRISTLATSIYDEAVQLIQPERAAALAVVLLFLTIIIGVIGVYTARDDKEGRAKS